MRRAALAGLLVCAASAAMAAESAPAPAAAPVEAKPYVSGFCGPIALNNEDPAFFGQLLNNWQAKANSSQGDDTVLQDAVVNGQAFVFPDTDAPRAIVDRRQSVCNLIYRSKTAPVVLLDEFKAVKIPVGPRDAPAPWLHANTRRMGRPGPALYAVRIGDSETFALCARVFEDLRLRDNTPATLVKVATCRLGGDETFDNG